MNESRLGGRSLAVRPTQSPGVRPPTPLPGFWLPEDRVCGARDRAAVADDLPTTVDGRRNAVALIAGEGPEVSDGSPLPEDGVRRASDRAAIAHNLPTVVDAGSVAPPCRPRESSQVGDGPLFPQDTVSVCRIRAEAA